MTRTLTATRTFDQRPLQWMPPAEPTSEDDIDWIAVERAVHGDVPTGGLNRNEARAAALIMTSNGQTERHVATSLGIYERQISRWRAAAKLAAGQTTRTCTTGDCTDFPVSRGMCNKHYKRTRAAEKAAAVGSSRCGSEAGYKTHRRYHTKVCTPCRAAHTEYGRASARIRATQDHGSELRDQLEVAA
ncbi:hypothetical protein ACWDBF_21090 [Streptomyces angustmyceticus]